MATRTTAVICALCVAVLHQGQGPFVGFNRHETLRGLSPGQHTEANSLRADARLTSAARELQFGLTKEWMTPAGLAPPAQLLGRPAVVKAQGLRGQPPTTRSGSGE